MTKTELLEIIRNGENSGVEFKRDDIQPRDFAEGLVELTNLEGGCILLGVENDGRVSGLTTSPEDQAKYAKLKEKDPDAAIDVRKITIDRVEGWVMNVARDKIRPEIIQYFETIRDVELGKDVAVISVQREIGRAHV